MRNILYYIGGTLSTLAVVTVGVWSFLASAATGDAIVVSRLAIVTLSAGQRSQWGAAVTAACPSVAAADMQRFYCRRDMDNGDDTKKLDVLCATEFVAAATDAEWLDAVLAGSVAQSSVGDVLKRAECGVLSAAAKATLRTAILGSFPGADVSTILDVDVRRTVVGQPEIKAGATYVRALSPGAARAGVADGSVVRVVGKVLP